MRLPRMKYADGYRKITQTQFGGYNHTESAGDGELWDMKNLCSDAAPLISVRPRRGLVETLASPGGIGAHNALYWVDGSNFVYDGRIVGQVSPGRKIFAGMGNRIVIFPDKKVYNIAANSFESLEARFSASGVQFTNGKLYGEDAECNTVYCPGVDFSRYFSAGDAVEITGCTKHPENNKTPIVREIEGDKMYFYEYVFTLDGTDEAPQGYIEPGTISFARTVPDMDYICVNENRLWGCKGDTIYCSKLGDPKNFNVFDGTGTDSFSVDAGSAGSFTACCSYLGYPCFFKERHIYKMYGDIPSNFQLIGGPDLGVMKGCAGSLAIANNTLFYLSTAGVMAYTGGVPSPIGECLGGTFSDATGGSDGLKYYVSMLREDRTRHLFVYDAIRDMWHREDAADALGWANLGGRLYLLEKSGRLWDVSGGSGELEPPVEWMAEFADFTEGSPEAKGYSKLLLRVELDEGSDAQVEIRYDSIGAWRMVDRLPAGQKRTKLLPVVPRRADHYRIAIRGRGGAVIHSLARQAYAGSENRTLKNS